ncbi:MAG: hypothetical protein ACREOI_07505 [bacterium]
MIENIKANLDQVDPAALQSIWEIVNHSKPKRVLSPKSTDHSTFRRDVTLEKPAEFIGENLTLDEYERLSPKERGMLQRRLKEQNHLWLKNKFLELKAAWLVVIDGEVIDWGKSLKNLPMARQNVEVSQRTGKFPFVFINDDLMAIEESNSAWHATNDPGDYYPTLPVTLSSASNIVELVGDFDIGASGTFVDYDFLRDRNLIQAEVGDYYEISRHLNQPYHGVAKSLRFQLSSKAGKAFAFETMIYCVPDWHISPFVKINPDRVALVGRDLLLTLKPKVLLDFNKRQTEIVPSRTASQARRKGGSKQKKRSSRSRRRH